MTMELFGTGPLGCTVDRRLKRCYVLAAAALTAGTAPADATLVHGTWQHVVYARQRITHGWLRLADGRVWEPVQAVLYPQIVWEAVMRPTEERTYTKGEAMNALMFHRHFGPWHDSEYP